MDWDLALAVLLEPECIQVLQQATNNFVIALWNWTPLEKLWWNFRITQALVWNTSRVSQHIPFISIMNVNYSLAGQLTTINRNRNPSSKPWLLCSYFLKYTWRQTDFITVFHICSAKQELLTFSTAELEETCVTGTLLTKKFRTEELWKFPNLPRHIVQMYCKVKELKTP